MTSQLLDVPMHQRHFSGNPLFH